MIDSSWMCLCVCVFCFRVFCCFVQECFVPLVSFLAVVSCCLDFGGTVAVPDQKRCRRVVCVHVILIDSCVGYSIVVSFMGSLVAHVLWSVALWPPLASCDTLVVVFFAKHIFCILA